MIPIILEKQKNIRDLGETVTLDGRRIKRNKLIRCGRLSDLSAADAAVLLGPCRVRTVVDLVHVGQRVAVRVAQVAGIGTDGRGEEQHGRIYVRARGKARGVDRQGPVGLRRSDFMFREPCLLGGVERCKGEEVYL